MNNYIFSGCRAVATLTVCSVNRNCPWTRKYIREIQGKRIAIEGRTERNCPGRPGPDIGIRIGIGEYGIGQDLSGADILDAGDGDGVGRIAVLNVLDGRVLHVNGIPIGVNRVFIPVRALTRVSAGLLGEPEVTSGGGGITSGVIGNRGWNGCGCRAWRGVKSTTTGRSSGNLKVRIIPV